MINLDQYINKQSSSLHVRLRNPSNFVLQEGPKMDWMAAWMAPTMVPVDVVRPIIRDLPVLRALWTDLQLTVCWMNWTGKSPNFISIFVRALVFTRIIVLVPLMVWRNLLFFVHFFCDKTLLELTNTPSVRCNISRNKLRSMCVTQNRR